MKILLIDFYDVVGSAGGMEKVLCSMSNEFVNRGHQVFIVCCDKNLGLPFYDLNEDVKFMNLNGTGKDFDVKIFLKLEKEIIRFFRMLNKERKEEFRLRFLYGKIIDNLKKVIVSYKPDIIITYDKNSIMLVQQLMEIDIPVIAMVHGDVNNILNDKASNFLKEAYEKSIYVQVLIKNNQEIVKKYCPKTKAVWIPNCVETTLEKDYNHKKKIVTVGRLNKEEKRQHLLIESFKKITDEIPPEWSVEIIGGTNNAGEENYKKCMQDYVERECLTNKISFTGPVKNVNQHLFHADIFAFPSSTEGFGLALTEAMAVGLPAIGYRSCSSVNELIIDGYNGFLCDDGIDDFAEKLKILIDDAELRKKMGQNARKLMKKYAPEKIWNQWEALINKVVSNYKEN